MLKVKTRLQQTKNRGIGLFADQFIPIGTIIWQYDSRIDFYIPITNDFNYSQIEKDFFEKYCPHQNGNYLVCVDNARFMNHSDSPNTIDIKGDKTIARFDIQKGEEIVCNYKDFDESENVTSFSD
jgi:SET domain-containing protein